MHPLALGYQTLGRTARVLPRPAAYAAARQMMTAVYHAWPRGRNAARRNAEHLLPHVDWDGDAGSLARAQFQRYGEYLVDAVRLDELTPADCYKAVGGDDPQPTLSASRTNGANWNCSGTSDAPSSSPSFTSATGTSSEAHSPTESDHQWSSSTTSVTPP